MPGVIKTAFVRLDRDGKIERFGQLIGQIDFLIHIEQADARFILPALLNTVRHQRAIFGDIDQVDAGGVIRTHGMGID